MELRRTGEALLRSHSTVLAFLAPSVTRSAFTRPSLLQCTSPAVSTIRSPTSRALSTTCRRYAENNASSSNTPKPSPSSRSTNSVEDLTKFLDEELDFTKGVSTTSTGRTSRFGSRNAQASNRGLPNDEASSFNDLIRRFEVPNPSTSRSQRDRSSSFNSIANMIDPLNNLANRPLPLPRPLPVRLGPSLGRTVNVDANKGIDVGRAFRSLEVACSRNRVKADFHRQRFHERPGLKRKRLKSERWRKRFKEGFKAVVKMVGRMKKKGW